MRVMVAMLVAAAIVGAAERVSAGCGMPCVKGASQASADSEEKPEAAPQAVCPVEGGKINKDVFADHNGLRVYFCCPACVEAFKADPEKYLKQLRESGVELDKAPEES